MEITAITNEKRDLAKAYLQHGKAHNEEQPSLEAVHDIVTISKRAQQRLGMQEAHASALATPEYGKDEPWESQDEVVTETAKQIHDVKERLGDARKRLSEAKDKIARGAPKDETASTEFSTSDAEAAVRAAQSKLRNMAFFSEALDVEAITIEVSRLNSELMALYRRHRLSMQGSSKKEETAGPEQNVAALAGKENSTEKTASQADGEGLYARSVAEKQRAAV